MTDRVERLTLQAMATKLGLHIGSRIRQAREEAGFPTQQALADQLPSPISNQYVSKWEKGVKPTDENLKRIAAAVGRDVGWFYEDFEKKPATPDLSMNSTAPEDDRIGQLLEAVKRLEQRLEDVAEAQGQATLFAEEVLRRIEASTAPSAPAQRRRRQ